MKSKVTFATVRKIALAMPDVEESSSYGTPSFKLRGSLMTCMAINKSAEPGSLAVRIDFDQRDHLLAEAPEIYYVTDHYVNYPVVLARLSKLDSGALRDLMGAAWRYVNSVVPKRKLKVRKRTRSVTPGKR